MATESYPTKQIKIKAVPIEMPSVSEHFETVENVQLPGIQENELLIQTEYCSVDPYQRARMGQWKNKTKEQQMLSYQVSKVVKSNNPKYKAGDFIYGIWPWSTFNVIKSDSILSKVPPKFSDDKKENKDNKFDLSRIEKEIPHSYYVGSYGMPGMTAYYGIITRASLKKGENVLISGAAGAVGSICGQIAKNVYECKRVVGIAGNPDKLKWLKEIGFDGTLNYKNFTEFSLVKAALKIQFPDGIDVYFDNVGGIVSEAVYDLLNVDARVVICGQISTYNDNPKSPKKIRPFLHKLIYRQIEIRGLYVGRFTEWEKFYREMGQWIVEGKIKVRETVVDGFDKLPEAFIGLFSGKNVGKMVVKCSK